MRRLIDLSVPIESTPSEATPVRVETLGHSDGPAVLGLEPSDFPGGMAISNETVTLTTHTGTHVDAPLHYGPRCAGEPARAIGEVPLEWCIGPGLRLDVRDCGDGEPIEASDLEAAAARAGREPEAGDVALVWTGRDRLWGTPEYLRDYPGLTRAATAYLVERGVRVIGIDAWGLDRPQHAMVSDYRASGDSAVLWPAHLYGREHEYLQVEKLAHLDRLPADHGYDVICLPVHVAGAGAGWTRAVAIVDDS